VQGNQQARKGGKCKKFSRKGAKKSKAAKKEYKARLPTAIAAGRNCIFFFLCGLPALRAIIPLRLCVTSPLRLCVKIGK
jgi:hypothetical protein